MPPKIKFGIIVGVIAGFFNIFLSAILGICSPVLAFFAGGVAGFLSTRTEVTHSKVDGAKDGSVSGAITGAIVLLGQSVGGVMALTFTQSIYSEFLGISLTEFGSEFQTYYWLTGFLFVCCFGAIGVGLSALGGAIIGYINTPELRSYDVDIESYPGDQY